MRIFKDREINYLEIKQMISSNAASNSKIQRLCLQCKDLKRVVIEIEKKNISIKDILGKNDVLKQKKLLLEIIEILEK